MIGKEWIRRLTDSIRLLRHRIARQITDQTDAEIAWMNSKAEQGKGPIIFLPEGSSPQKPTLKTISWARDFTQNGYLSIITQRGRVKKRRIFQEISANVFLYQGDLAALGKLNNSVIWANRESFDCLKYFPPNAMLLYHLSEASKFDDGNAIAFRQHEQALDEAALVLCETESIYRQAVAVRDDAIFVPNVENARRDRQYVPPTTTISEPAATENVWHPCDVAEELWKQKRFQRFLKSDNRHFHRAVCRHYQRDHESWPCLNLYFEYAMSTNDRGRVLAEKLAQYSEIAGKRYLDVGCAYAGFLVAMAERGAIETAGIDIDPRLLTLARANLKDQNLRAKIAQADLTKPEEIKSYLGRFDIITCNDVIEHVLDPAQAIRNVSDMLAPGGMAYFEIPNPFCPQSILEDIHFRWFGITLLDREEAKEYFTYRSPNFPYSMGHYLELPRFVELLEQAGLKNEVLAENFANFDAASVQRQIDSLRNSYPEHLKRVPEPMQERVKRKVEVYLDDAARTPQDSSEQQRQFVLRFGPNVWKVLGWKR